MISNSGENAVVRIGDFGCAKMLEHGREYGSLNGTLNGTQEYMSPDIYSNLMAIEMNIMPSTRLFGYSHELWPIGVSMFEMATGRLPFRPPGGRKNCKQMYQMTSNKSDDTISFNTAGLPEHDLPANCNIQADLRSSVRALIAGLLKTKEIWSIERFETEMKTLTAKSKHGKEHKKNTVKEGKNQKENRTPRQAKRSKLSVPMKRYPLRNRKLTKWHVGECKNNDTKNEIM